MPSRAALKQFFLGIEEDPKIDLIMYSEDSPGRVCYLIKKTKLLKYLEFQEEEGIIDTEDTFKCYKEVKYKEFFSFTVEEKMNKEKEEQILKKNRKFFPVYHY